MFRYRVTLPSPLCQLQMSFETEGRHLVFLPSLNTRELLTLPTRTSGALGIAAMGFEQAVVQRAPLPSRPLLLLQSAQPRGL